MPEPSELRLFVSHVREDRAAALEVVGELERRGISCWIAPRDVHPGRPFDDEIVDAIEGSRAVLLIFSDRCNDSDYIRREVTVAGESHKIIIPFRIEDAQPRRGLRVRLSDLHWIDAFAERERALDDVAKQFGIPDSPVVEAPRPVREPPPRARPVDMPRPPPARAFTVNRSWLLTGAAIVAAVLVGVGLAGFLNRAPAPVQQAAVTPAPPPSPAPPITIQPLGSAFNPQPAAPANTGGGVPVTRTLLGHQGYVAALAFSPDGKELVSVGGPDMSIKFWDLSTGQMIRSVWGSEKDGQNLTSVVFTPGGRLVAVAGWEGLIKFFNVASGDLVTAFRTEAGMIHALSISPDGRRIAAAVGASKIQIWDIARGQLMQTVGGEHGDVNAVVYSPDGKMFASATNDNVISPRQDNSIKLWSAATGELLHTIPDDPGHFTKLAFAPDGQTLASTGYLNTAKVWDVASGRLVHNLYNTMTSWGIAYSPDGKTLAVGTSSASLWNPKTGEPIRVLDGPTGTYYCLAFSPDGRLVASGSQDRAVRLWDVSKVATAGR